MLKRCALVKRGINTPLSLASTCNFAEACGVFVPIPTLSCAFNLVALVTTSKTINIL
jgi:hypothetical protein